MPGAGGVDAAGFAGAAGHSAMLRGASRSLLLYRLHWWSDSLERSLPNESVDGLIFTRFRDEVELLFFSVREDQPRVFCRCRIRASGHR